MKRCKTCHKLKRKNEFYKHKLTKDKLFPECKSCNIKRATRWQNANPEKKRINDRRNWKKHREKRIRAGKKCYDKREYGGLRVNVLKRDNYKCVFCGMTQNKHIKKWGSSLNVDHINRNRKENIMNNLQTVCLICHGKKHIGDNQGKGQFKRGHVPWNKQGSKWKEMNN